MLYGFCLQSRCKGQLSHGFMFSILLRWLMAVTSRVSRPSLDLLVFYSVRLSMLFFLWLLFRAPQPSDRYRQILHRRRAWINQKIYRCKLSWGWIGPKKFIGNSNVNKVNDAFTVCYTGHGYMELKCFIIFPQCNWWWRDRTDIQRPWIDLCNYLALG